MKFFLVSHKLGIVNTSIAPEGSNTIRTVLPSATPVVYALGPERSENVNFFSDNNK